MATTNDSAVVDLGRLKTFKSKLDASMEASSVNAETSPFPSQTTNYKHANAEGPYSCALGNNSYAKGDSSIAIGTDAAAAGENCVSLGFNAKSDQYGSTAIGSNSMASAEKCVCVGQGSLAQSNNCTALGDGAVAVGTGGNTAIGATAVVDSAAGSDAIGANAHVVGAVQHAVALGAESVANEDKTVSMGNDSFKRRIVNVENPTNDTDAATKVYVDSFTTQVIEIGSVTSTLTSDQLNTLENNWPNVILTTANTNTAYFPGSRVTNNQGIDIFTLYAIDSTTNNVVQVGTDHKINLVIQIDIESENGNISFVENYLAFPAIATNPRLTDNVGVLATGTNSVAAGSGSQASGINSIAIGNIAKALDSNTVAVGNGATALGLLSVALGLNSKVSHASSIAIGPQTTASHTSSVAFGAGTKTDRNYQVSIGDKASGITRYLSNVKDPVEDQDAATRYWTKNADRSDVFATNHDPAVAGGTGEFYLEANADLNWFAVRGYVSWSSFATAWGNMVRLPGTSDSWWIKTALKVPTAMIPKTNFIAYCSAIDYLGDHSVPYSHDHIAVGTDGYIYVSAWDANHGSTPLGIQCLGHRFYM